LGTDAPDISGPGCGAPASARRDFSSEAAQKPAHGDVRPAAVRTWETPLAAVLVLAVLAASACAAKQTDIPTGAIPEDAVRLKTFHVASHGWHTGIILPGSEVNAAVPRFGRDFGDVRYYEIGWGDEGFYRAARIDPCLVLKAVFWPTDAVIHVVGFSDAPSAVFPGSEVVALHVSEHGFRRLVAFIAESFARDPSGHIQPLGPGIYGRSRFYRASGTYLLWNTCNTWTAKGLKRSGIRILPVFTPTAACVMSHVRRAAARMEGSPPVDSPKARPPDGE
jgi:uncharacterized protein (TIGR02117 family)